MRFHSGADGCEQGRRRQWLRHRIIQESTKAIQESIWGGIWYWNPARRTAQPKSGTMSPALLSGGIYPSSHVQETHSNDGTARNSSSLARKRRYWNDSHRERSPYKSVSQLSQVPVRRRIPRYFQRCCGAVCDKRIWYASRGAKLVVERKKVARAYQCWSGSLNDARDPTTQDLFRLLSSGYTWYMMYTNHLTIRLSTSFHDCQHVVNLPPGFALR